MKVLVTGGAGFIGSHLVEALLTRGDTVRVLDNFSTGKRAHLAGHATVEIIEGDIRDQAAVSQAVTGCEQVFHLAAMVSVPRSMQEPGLNHEVNVTGAFHVFEAARQAGIRRVVYASSAAVYGDVPALPARESDPVRPISPYALAKWSNEQYAATFNRCYNTEFVGLRYFNVFGPRQDPSSPYSGVLSIFCRAAIAGGGVTIYGDGQQTRDFVYVSDVVAANLAAANLAAAKVTAAGEGQTAVYNIGRGEATDLLAVVDTLRAHTGSDLPVTFAAARPGDILHSVADIGRARAGIDYQPGVPVAAGLQETLAWFQQEAKRVQ